VADSLPSRRAGGAPDAGVDHTAAAGAPRWVKVFGIVALVLVLLFAVLHLSGNSLGGHDLHRGHSATQGGP
jgi:hypothetical protein